MFLYFHDTCLIKKRQNNLKTCNFLCQHISYRLRLRCVYVCSYMILTLLNQHQLKQFKINRIRSLFCAVFCLVEKGQDAKFYIFSLKCVKKTRYYSVLFYLIINLKSIVNLYLLLMINRLFGIIAVVFKIQPQTYLKAN